MYSKFSLTVFISLCCFAALSQPGYMGKRFQAGYGFNFSPAIIGSNGAGKSMNAREGSHAEYGYPAFNKLHEVFIEYCIKRRTMIGFSGKYYKTTYDNRHSLGYFNYDNKSGVIVSGKPEGLYTIQAINYSLYFKFYFSRYIAPWGKYLMIGPSLNQFTCSYDPNTMYVRANQYTPIDVAKRNNYFGSQQQGFMRFDILVGLGKNRIIADCITLDYGINFEVVSLQMTLFDLTDALGNGDIPNSEYIQKTCRSRMREVNRVNAFIKVGYLF